MLNMINDEQLHKWVNGELSEEELIAFKLRPEYDSLVELYKNTSSIDKRFLHNGPACIPS